MGFLAVAGCMLLVTAMSAALTSKLQSLRVGRGRAWRRPQQSGQHKRRLNRPRLNLGFLCPRVLGINAFLAGQPFDEWGISLESDASTGIALLMPGALINLNYESWTNA